MTHLAASLRLSAYLDGELPAPERRAVDAHLRGCATCRRDLAELTRVKSLLGALPEVDLPAEVLAGVRDRLAPVGPAGVLAAWLRGAVRRPAVVVAAAVVAVMLTVLPMAKGRIDRLQAADIGVDVYVREHAVLSAADPFADPAYLGLLLGDANVALVGQRRMPQERR